MIYKWRSGAHVKGVKAQDAGERLEQLRAEHAGITAQIVVDDARDEASVLHPAFEWQDERAADEWRLFQARHMIASVVVVREDVATAPPMRAFVVVSDTQGEQKYESISIALSDPSQRMQVLSRARVELEQWRQRYKELQEFAAVFDVIDRTAQEVA